MSIFKNTVILFLLLSSGWLLAQKNTVNGTVSAEQQQRIAQLRSKNVDATLTILPVKVLNRHWERVSEIIGAILEQKGLKNIEVGHEIFVFEKRADVNVVADSLRRFVHKNPVATDYLLYAEMNGDENPPPIDELFGLLVDKNGDIVWSDYLNSGDSLFSNVSDPDPMGYSILLTELMEPYFGLNTETARNAKPGKMAALMRERSGLPPEEEMNEMTERVKIMQSGFKKSELVIFPLRVAGKPDTRAANDLVSLINQHGITKAKLSGNSLLLEPPEKDPNEMKVLWNMARQFREYIKAHPIQGDYFLYGDYVFTPGNWAAGYVHFVVCDSHGDWVIADLQNSQHQDYFIVQPVSVEGCNQIIYNRLMSYIKLSAAAVIKETMESAGISQANKKFKELMHDDDYILSEAEMNNLGYEYLGMGEYDKSIAILSMNTEAFPESYNTFDSLGEAYATKGDTKAAITNYEKSVKLNPGNQNGIRMLESLKSSKK